MSGSEVAIANLVYRYAEYIDGGDFVAATALLEHARIKTAVGEFGPAEVIDRLLSTNSDHRTLSSGDSMPHQPLR